MLGYVEWSVIAGQTPTESQWNVLGDNQDLFAQEFDDRSPSWVTLSDGATVTINLDSGYGKYYQLAIAGNRTIAFSNAPTDKPQVILLKVIQAGAGGYQLSFPATTMFEYDQVPVLATGNGYVDFLMIIVDTSNYYVIHAGREMY